MSVFSILALIGIVLLNSLVSAARSTLSSIRRQPLREAAESGDKRAARILELADDSDQAQAILALSGMLLSVLAGGLVQANLSTLVNIPRVTNVVTDGLILVAAVIVLYMLSEFLAELMIHRQDSNITARRLLGFLNASQAVLFPILRVSRVLRYAPFGGEADTPGSVTEEEIMTLVAAGEEEGSIEIQEREMISRVFQLDETVAREIMVPRIDIIALAVDTPLEEARRVVIDAGHSRIPVFGESLDKIQGLLYAKDLLVVWDEGGQPDTLQELLRPAVFVPETQPVSELLQELQNQTVHLAIVVDEYGGTAGLVTIEDIVEEIVGEILDEYDEDEEALFTQLSEDEYIFDARIDLDDFERMLEVRVPIEHGEETLGGLIYARLGKIPDAGEVIKVGALQMEVLSVVDQRVRKVRVVRTQPDETQTTAESESNNGR